MAHDHTPQGYYSPEGSALEGQLHCPQPHCPQPADHEVGSGQAAPDSVSDLEASIDWGAEGALASVLLSAALADVAPSPVRDRVLSAVDAVLREPVAVPAFPAETAPVTTLSGVFEKRRPATPVASCVEATQPTAAVEDGACFEPPPVVGAVEPAPADDAALASVAPESTTFEDATFEAVAFEEATFEDAPAGSAVLESADGKRDSLWRAGLDAGLPGQASVVARSSSTSTSVARNSVHPRASISRVDCCGGPIVGGRCRSRPPAVDIAPARPSSNSPLTDGGVVQHPVVRGSVVRGSVVRGSVVRGSVVRGSVVRGPVARGPVARGRAVHLDSSVLGPARAVVASNLDVALAVPERSALARVREGLVAGAFNLAQLAAAILVGIVIGKGAHLVMAEENAMAWNAGAGSEGGLRAEPSRNMEVDGAANRIESFEPLDNHFISRVEDALDSSEPLDSREPAAARVAPRARVASAARASSRANASSRRVAAASARPAAPCNVAAAQATPSPSPAAIAGSWEPSMTSGSGASQATNGAGVASGSCGHEAGAAGSTADQLANVRIVAPELAPLSSRHARRPRAVSALAANVQPPLVPASDDWLGEQLAILGRAERSLHDGDAESAVRSLDEYQARFPDGLLDPQIASIRQRVEERFTAFIFP